MPHYRTTPAVTAVFVPGRGELAADADGILSLTEDQAAALTDLGLLLEPVEAPAPKPARKAAA